VRWYELRQLIIRFDSGGALRAEIIATAVILLLAILAPRIGSKCFRSIETALRRVASQKLLSILIIGLLAFWISAIRSFLTQVPQPSIHDEFSYLLAADTFAKGRLANPTPPSSDHFESFHIIQKPTYASKYPPAQGLFLALGELVFGYPIAGVWFSIACACMAICWMLQAYLSPSWALAGAFLAMVRLVMLGQSPPSTVAGYWSQSYWGGAVAALGGALLFGAVRRVFEKPSLSQAGLMALGLAILANSRPYEGLLASLPVIGVLGFRLFGKNAESKRTLITNTLLPLGGMLLFVVLLMGYYNSRLTGRWTVMPYQLYEEQYSVAPVFLWQSLKPEPEYHHQIIRNFNLAWALPTYLGQRSFRGFLAGRTTAILMTWNFFVQVILLLPLIALRRSWRDPWIRFALLTCTVVMCGVLLETWNYPHYAAPITALIYLIIAHAMSRIRIWRLRQKHFGLFLVRGILAACFIFCLVPLGRTLETPPGSWAMYRARLIAQLKHEPGKHLILVRYMPQHPFHSEWVYNEADIEGAKVVWARDMGPDKNRQLLADFKDRRVWLLLPDIAPQLIPYQGSSIARISEFPAYRQLR
jgi:hypothetical protein